MVGPSAPLDKPQDCFFLATLGWPRVLAVVRPPGFISLRSEQRLGLGLHTCLNHRGLLRIVGEEKNCDNPRSQHKRERASFLWKSKCRWRPKGEWNCSSLTKNLSQDSPQRQKPVVRA